MNHTLTTIAEVRADHTLVLTVPSSIPPGRVRVKVTVEPEGTPRPMTPQELAHSEFAGDWIDREDIPDSVEYARQLRQTAWERQHR